MKQPVLKLTPFVIAAALGVAIGASKYSGIYSGKASANKLPIAVTSGGRVIGLDQGGGGIDGHPQPRQGHRELLRQGQGPHSIGIGMVLTLPGLTPKISKGIVRAVMKRNTLEIAAFALIATVGATIAQSKFSGIYAGKMSKEKFLIAASKGGRVIGLGDGAEGLNDTLDPAKSTVNSAGKLKGSTPGGGSLTATIKSDFTISGTVKDGGSTIKLSGKRTYK